MMGTDETITILSSKSDLRKNRLLCVQKKKKKIQNFITKLLFLILFSFFLKIHSVNFFFSCVNQLKKISERLIGLILLLENL